MPYVTACESDIFLSYAHEDDAIWIENFERELHHHLTQRLGQRPDVWQDKNRLRVGHMWEAEIEEGITSSAAFVAILSPNYENSDWCSKERTLFLEHLGGVEKMLVETPKGKMFRFLKVIRLPWEKDGHLGLLREAQHYEFFVRDEKTMFDETFKVGSEEFRKHIEYFAYVVSDLLRALRRRSEAVFVASTSEDVSSERNALATELRDQGYDVWAKPVDDFYSEAKIQEALEPAVMSIHVIGADYREYVNRQIEVARKLDKRMVFWISRDAERNARGKQVELIKLIRGGKEMPSQFWTLENGTDREKIAAVLHLLKPSAEARTFERPAGGAPWMYLICDRSSREDAEFAERLQKDILAQEKIEVALPEARLDSARAIREAHEELMRQCDGVLLYRRSAPEEWLWEHVTDVLFAEKKLARERPLRAKGFLVDQAELLEGVPSVPVYPQREPFHLDAIGPFFDSIRRVPV